MRASFDIVFYFPPVDAVGLSCDARESHSYTFVCLSEYVMCRCSVTNAVGLQWDLKVENETHTQIFLPTDSRGQFEMANGFNFTLDEKEQDPDHPLRGNLTSSVIFLAMTEVTNITIQCGDFMDMMVKTLFVPGKLDSLIRSIPVLIMHLAEFMPVTAFQ